VQRVPSSRPKALDRKGSKKSHAQKKTKYIRRVTVMKQETPVKLNASARLSGTALLRRLRLAQRHMHNKNIGEVTDGEGLLATDVEQEVL
jgi:hypothetical protein